MSERRDPWSKFYWSDWRSDPKLRACGLGARGLWVEMLGLMHESAPYGHLLINGTPPTDQQLAVIVGASVAEVRRYKAELAAAGVPSIEDGIWISRRMVRDAQRRAINQANGAGGGNPKLKNSDNRTRPVRITDPVKPADKSHDARDPEARSQKPETAPSGAASDAATPAKRANAVRLALCEVFETDENRTPGWALFGPISAWLEAGADPDLDILPTARAMASRFAGKRPPASPAYLTNAVMEALQARRGIAAKAPALVVVDPAKEAAAQRFNAAMDAWIAGGRQGPMPVREPASDPLDIPKFLDRRTA